MIPKPIKTDKTTGTYVDTIEFDVDTAKGWLSPTFQRPIRANHKVQELANSLKANSGVLPGILCFGLLGTKQYLIDGQQRREAFLISGCEKGYADARFCRFNSLAEMAEEFVKLNTHLVAMKPDDILRGLEPSLDCLRIIRKSCPFVGYENIRRNEGCAVVSMSAILRVWRLSAADVPGGSTSSAVIAQTTSDEDAVELSEFLNLCMKAWGADGTYSRLWTNLNMILCAWLFRRLVLTNHSAKTARLTRDQFCRCLMSLSASETYIDWLQGRMYREHDRGPAYARIKALFVARLNADTGKKMALPAPAWAAGR